LEKLVHDRDGSGAKCSPAIGVVGPLEVVILCDILSFFTSGWEVSIRGVLRVVAFPGSSSRSWSFYGTRKRRPPWLGGGEGMRASCTYILFFLFIFYFSLFGWQAHDSRF
jgi:hypothetical protein